MNYDSKQIETAAIITKTGLEVGASYRQIIAALETAWVESRLGKLDGGDNGTAWGVFQQTPHNGWGSKTYVQNPYNAARSFFLGVGKNPGLLDVWNENRSEGLNAQKVQRSAFPLRYDAAKSVAVELFQAIQSRISGIQIPTSPTQSEPTQSAPPKPEAPPEPPPPDLTKPTANTSNLQRVMVLSIGLVLIVLAFGSLNKG